MLPATPTTRMPEDAYHRGLTQYDKTLKTLNRIDLTQWVIIATGIALLLFAADSFTYPLNELIPLSAILIIFLVSAILIASGALIWSTMHRINKRHRYRDFDYRIALFFLKELGHTNPAATLDQNPKYLITFRAVFRAVTKELTAAGKARAIPGRKITTIGLRKFETLSPAHRVASLVLTDEQALSKAPQLLAVIQEQHLTDYDQLFALMDTMS